MQRSNPYNKTDAGFTLAELLVVLAILSLVLVLAAPNFSRLLSAESDAKALQKLQFSLEQTRRYAVRRSEEVVFKLNVETGAYWANRAGVQGQLPDDWAIDIEAALQEQDSPEEIGIRYWPSGASTGARIHLAYDNSETFLEVDWLTGITHRQSGDDL